MTFALIAACDRDMGIGKGGALPWRLPGELAHFHRVTSEASDASKRNVVIMGRKTWESIPEHRRPLPGRLNCVITRKENYELPAGALRFGSLTECLNSFDQRKPPQAPPYQGGDDVFPPLKGWVGEVSASETDKIFIIGGGELFRQAITMPACETIYLTKVDGVFGCDTFFPEIPGDYKVVEESPEQEENGVRYRFLIYKRQKQ